jgi:threonine/homoserine/homoserine lactone efflux protein
MILEFALASLLIELTPGPNMTYLTLVSARWGRRSGLFAAAGVALGLAIIGSAAALGLTSIIVASPTLYNVLRWLGVGYLLYLAYLSWNTSIKGKVIPSGEKFFVRGLVNDLLNVKAMIFYVTVLPTFLDSRSSVSQALLLTAINIGIATVIHVTLVVMAGTLQPLLNNVKRMKYIGRGFAFALIGVAGWLAWSSSRTGLG